MRKVITYGTFDLFHLGHYNILKRAKEQGDYLIVGVTSESYDIERGKLAVKDSLTTRIENVMKTGFVDEVIIEEYLGQKIRDIIKYDVDVFVIGDDWKGKYEHLKDYCEVVYLERTKNISSTQIREEQDNIFKIGIVTDQDSDYGYTREVQYVSGLHVENILVEDKDLGERFCEKYRIDRYHTDFDEFAQGLSIVIVSTAPEKREVYVRKALDAGKHVIVTAPIVMNTETLSELQQLAKDKGLALIENITTVYLRAFTQLMWMVHSDILGNVCSVRCSISQDSVEGHLNYSDMETLGIAMIVKTLGTKMDNIVKKTIKDENGNIKYSNIYFNNGQAVGNLEIGVDVELDDELVIVGENATVIVKNDWWNTGYFEVKYYNEKFVKKYSYNFEGTGFRYILQELLIMLRDKRNECTRLFREESLAIVDIMNQANMHN